MPRRPGVKRAPAPDWLPHIAARNVATTTTNCAVFTTSEASGPPAHHSHGAPTQQPVAVICTRVPAKQKRANCSLIATVMYIAVQPCLDNAAQAVACIACMGECVRRHYALLQIERLPSRKIAWAAVHRLHGCACTRRKHHARRLPPATSSGLCAPIIEQATYPSANNHHAIGFSRFQVLVTLQDGGGGGKAGAVGPNRSPPLSCYQSFFCLVWGWGSYVSSVL